MNKNTTSPFQLAINAIVIVLAILFIYAFISEFTYDEYTDNVLPDDIIDLDEQIEDFLLEVEPNFESLLENPGDSIQHELVYLDGIKSPISDESNYKQSIKSVVYITAEDDEYIWYGSGSILTSDGLIITNSHVIDDSHKVVVTTYDGRHHEVESVPAYDDLLDIAFLRINAEGLVPLPIGNSDEILVGQKTLVIGHAEGFLNTLSIGNVSAIRNYDSREEGENIQITNPISSGNSGGALLNDKGELIGVPTWSLEYEDNISQVQNINFAVSINDAIDLLNDPGSE
jgi:S1-C subfamily serine protease